mgnify:CR=1 FL=1|jgi:Restriction endonuclease S subunits
MKTLVKKRGELIKAGRWDIDFHLPAEGIKRFSTSLLQRVDKVADIATDKRDPTREPDTVFQYIDIASVDVTTGTIVNPQELAGEEAPSRARKVVRAFDIIVSTCRPTRGAIAVVPPSLHNQIASTAFSIVRAKPGVNPFYLHYALRLESTLEQFRKWSTGSSYPAILDDDVEKTLIPVPGADTQERIAAQVMDAFRARDEAIKRANAQWDTTLSGLTTKLAEGSPVEHQLSVDHVSLSSIQQILDELPPLTVDLGRRRGQTVEDDQDDMFTESEAA